MLKNQPPETRPPGRPFNSGPARACGTARRSIIELAKNFGYSRKQLREIEALIEEHYDELIGAWQEHFGS
ncbi:MAG: DUF4160 domain-containing protein [Wenzhouxiangellaceae bacterium]